MTQRTRISVVVVCLGAFMAGLDLFIVNIAFPALQDEFSGASLGGLSWVLNAYTIVFAALLVPAGRWADAYGRKRVFLIGLALFTTASAACALAWSVETLVAMRVIQAAGAALMLPTSLALLLPEFKPHQRSVAVAGWAAVSAVAAAAGPPIGGLLVEASWRWVFLVNVPVGVGALIVGARVLRESREPDAARPDGLGAVLLAAGIAALVGGIVEGPNWGWADPRTLGAWALAVALLAIVARRCLHHPAPVVDPELLRIRPFRVAVLSAMLFFAAFGAMLLTSVLFLTGPWGRDVLQAGLEIAPGPAMAALFSIPGAKLARRIGMAKVGAAGTALFALGMLWWLTQLGSVPNYAGEFLPGMIICGIGVGLVIPTITAAAAVVLPPDRFATGTGVLTMGRQVGVAIGVAVLVALLGDPKTVGDFDSAYAFMLGISAASGLMLRLLGHVEANQTASSAVTEPLPEPAPVREAVTA
jgi:EmrB/QacA subfamily drug resistance transporter